MMTGKAIVGPWRLAGWGLIALLLLLPAIAMQVTDEVNWTASDFVFAAVLLGGTGLLVELAMRRGRRLAYRLGAIVTLGAALLLVWVDAAVQIIGDAGQPLNALYPAILAVALAAAMWVKGRASALATVTVAIAMALLAMLPVAIVAGGSQPPGIAGLAIFHLVFVALFLCAATLFRRAAHAEVAGQPTPA